jgi:flagellin-specific chaperone FliS
MTNNLHAYRTSSAEGATYIGLLLSVYDALAEDLRFAGDAAANGDISCRCRYSQHALLLLGHLESWVPLLEDDAVLQESLTLFYTYLRSQILGLQVAGEEEGFAELAMKICETRAVWQKKQSQAPSAVQVLASEFSPPEIPEDGDNSRFCWSA